MNNRSQISEITDNRVKIESLCLAVQKFLLSMRRLQRAVNSKDKDIQVFKVEFENNKKNLEALVKEIKDQPMELRQ